MKIPSESNVGLPFMNQATTNFALHQVARQLCIALYWQKFNEDRKVYFDKVPDLQSRIARVLSGAKQTLSEGGAESDSSSSDSEDDGVSGLADFLLSQYNDMTPQVFDPTSCKIVAKSRQVVNGVCNEKRFSELSCSLDNVDEFVFFKKFFVTALNGDRERIKEFIEVDSELVKLTDFVFRCRRIRFSADRTQEQIRLIYNFQI